ncbi:MAG: triose-phosphate isomerase [Deltaproteobacteria bacterium]|nr:triose-phosphate isomerase [Deltaproteobacteria bacterium]
MIKPLIAANWKMNKTVRESVEFSRKLKEDFAEYRERDIVVAPAFTALYPVSEILKTTPINVAAQNIHQAEKGAFTGEISAAMIADVGCSNVIVGHSERRTLFSETNNTINRKLIAAIEAGLAPIFCIGETLNERNDGRTFEVIKNQIEEGLNIIETDDIGGIVVAYEPVWAIGTGRTASAEQAEEAHLYIRSILREIVGAAAEKMRIIYGGSVNEKNIAGLMRQPNINGALVGGASLDYISFKKIVRH